MIYLAADPGSTTGICAVNVLPLGQVRWVGDASVAKPQRRVNEEHASLELRYVERLVTAFRRWPDARVIVLERPADGAGFWAGQGQKGQRRGTAFALGMHYAAALLAAHQVSPEARIVTYPVLGKVGERGWMPPRTQRATLLAVLRSQAVLIGAPENLSDHVLMAFGVLQYHLALRGESRPTWAWERKAV